MAQRRSPVPILIADYTVKSYLSQGRDGYVVKAFHRHQKFYVIIKVVSDNHELQLLSSFDHPYIVNFLEAFQKGTRTYIVMEYVSGGDLYSKINTIGKFSEQEALSFFSQIVDAVYYLHIVKTVAHRDLKPENILLAPDGTIRLCDFAFAAPISPESNQTEWLGSPEYCSPEIVKMIPYSGNEVDIWALGVLLFEMLNGKVPFPNHEFDSLPSLSHLSPECSDLIQSMLSVNRENRININQVKNHPWLNPQREIPSRPLDRMI